MITLTALGIGFALDLLLGDPPRWPHLVTGIGRLIAGLERLLRRSLPATPRGEFIGGLALALLIPAVSAAAAWGVLWLSGLVHPLLRLAMESLLVWQCLALKSLGAAGMAVHEALARNDLPAARLSVGRIVGRDTAQLDETGVARAAVETVAENTGDGVIAPLLFLALGGPALGVWYKAVNTLDSMVGYKNERYLYFGRAAARLDDAANFLPARIAALLMIAAAPLAGLSGGGAWATYRRDQHRHPSPNAGHPEAACAGALGVRLGGDAVYSGRLVTKPQIGAAGRAPAPGDIRQSVRLLYWSGCIGLILCLIIRGVMLWS